MKKILILGFLSVFFFSCSLDQVKKDPYPDCKARVNDYVNVLDQDQVNKLESRLKAFEDSTSNQLVILIVPSLNGEVIEDYANKVFEKWKLGAKKKNNGILFLFSIEDRQSRIEVGYGLEGAFTDLQSSQITEKIIPQYFSQQQYFEGINASLDVVMADTHKEYTADSQSAAQKSKINPLYVIIGLIIYFVVFTIIGIAIGDPFLAIWIALRVLLAVASGGKSGGSSGGFSGGGGSSGGGGASGRW